MAIYKFKTNQTLVDRGFNQTSGGTLTLSGNNLISDTATLRYVNDVSDSYVARSVVDAGFVTGITSAIINTGSQGEIIYRDASGITGATHITYDPLTSGLTVSNLSFSNPPETASSDYFLTWDDVTGVVTKKSASTAVGLTLAENGLSVIGTCAVLGGDLDKLTIIDGLSSHGLRFCNLYGSCISTTENDIVLDSRNDTGGIYLKSQSGIVNTAASFSNAVGISINHGLANGFKIIDNRAGSLQSGIEYDANYGTFFNDRSLVDKAYVDVIASGLSPKQAVVVATTGNTALSGLSATVIIDDVTLNQGDRVLIKNQIDARDNGIYILTGTTFQRSSDFDEDSEVVQGSYTFVISGDTNKSTTWVLSTPDPIAVNVTELTFTLFGQITNIIAGTGIGLSKYFGEYTIYVDGASLTGNSIVWSGNTFNVDVDSGTVSTAFNSKLDVDVFESYSASTSNVMDYVLISSAYTTTRYNDVVGVSGLSTSEISLYSTPVQGQRLSVVDVCGNALTEPITINGNGKNINGFTSACINTNFGSVTLVYNGFFWSAISFIN